MFPFYKKYHIHVLSISSPKMIWAWSGEDISEATAEFDSLVAREDNLVVELCEWIVPGSIPPMYPEVVIRQAERIAGGKIVMRSGFDIIPITSGRDAELKLSEFHSVR